MSVERDSRYLWAILALGTLQKVAPCLLPASQPQAGEESRRAELVLWPHPAFLALAKGPRQAALGNITAKGTPAVHSAHLCPGKHRGLPAQAGAAQPAQHHTFLEAHLAPGSQCPGTQSHLPLPLFIPRIHGGSAVPPSLLRAIQTVLLISALPTLPLRRQKGTLSSGRTHFAIHWTLSAPKPTARVKMQVAMSPSLPGY